MAPSALNHLFASVVSILRVSQEIVNGTPSYNWIPVQTGVRCRLDLTFLPVSRMEPLVIEAGRAPDRVGTAWFAATQVGLIKPGDRISTTAGPITGVYSVDQIPDQVGDLNTLHHLEIYIREVSQALAQIQET